VIIDSGVDGNHEFLSRVVDGQRISKVIEGACFSSGGNCPNNQTQQTHNLAAGVPCTYDPAGCNHGTRVANQIHRGVKQKFYGTKIRSMEVGVEEARGQRGIYHGEF